MKRLLVVVSLILALGLALGLALKAVATSPNIPPLMDASWPFRMTVSRTLLHVGDPVTLTLDSFPISPVKCQLTVPSGLTIDQSPELGDKGGVITHIFPHEGSWTVTGKVTKPGNREIVAVFDWPTAPTTLHLNLVVSKE